MPYFTLWMLDPDKAQHIFVLDLGQNCLQRLSEDNKSRPWWAKSFTKQLVDVTFWLKLLAKVSFDCNFLYPPQTMFVVGYTVFTLSVRACVRPSVRPSVRNALFP